MLSPSTLNVLRQLQSPVEIRFYALLADELGTTSTRSFAERVSRLLADYEKEAKGMIHLSRMQTRTSETEAAARMDGLAPLVRSTRGTNYLGLALRCGEQSAAITRLAPEWEAALEFDLSRAILQISGGQTEGRIILNPTPESFAARDELRRAFPELDTLSLAEGRQQLQAAGLEEYKEAVAGFQEQLQEAKQRLAMAQSEGPAETEAARQALHALQARQIGQLRVLSQRLQERLAALEQIKAGNL